MSEYPFVFEDGIVTHPDSSTAPTVVGTRPWDDNDDSTYAVSNVDSAGGVFALPGVRVQPLTWEGDVVDILWQFRASQSHGGSGSPSVQWFFTDETGVNLFNAPNVGLDDSAAVQDRGPFASPMHPEDLDAFLALLSAGDLHIWASAAGFFGGAAAHSVTVYQFEMGLVTDLVVPPVEEIRVTRQFPRDDAYGAGSATRIHPPPRRGRIVGGQT